MGRVVPAMMRLPTLLFLLVSVSYEDSPLRSNTSKARACYEWEVEYHGGGLENPMVTGVSDADQCQQLCQGRQGCNYFTWLSSQHEFSGYRNTCWLKSTQGAPQACKTCVSGPRSCGGEPNPDPCTFGAACDDCGVWAEVNGVRYCCASQCDWGNVFVWTENGQVQCQCTH
eukprot:TRINITY_DN1230_c0_g1_i1.p1 TRINITY_DN1230_c0_g1~~TRINITY_DN1230_c0_g1_i1.p1  ORF type:complete len:186 (-),score=61.14 TRINITY_DN1230_c0_g1_i1:40-552(-)